MANKWDKLPPRPLINLEPNYEEINNTIDAEDVRNASYWSLFATPMAGITYGANGIWPWIREGENILNHRQPRHVSTWRQSIDFPGSIQIGDLSAFIQQFEWWKFRPANHLLVEQPGDSIYNHFISVSEKDDHSLILVYVPRGDVVKLRIQDGDKYTGKWYDPATNKTRKAELKVEGNVIVCDPGGKQDMVLTVTSDQ